MKYITTNRSALTLATIGMCVLGAPPRMADAVVVVSFSIIKIADTNTPDIDGDGFVDAADLAQLLANWTG